MILREKIKTDEKLNEKVLVCYNLMFAAFQDEFAEMLALDYMDSDTFEKIVVDTCNYLKTKVKKSIKKSV